jgi:hypothetical protein
MGLLIILCPSKYAQIADRTFVVNSRLSYPTKAYPLCYLSTTISVIDPRELTILKDFAGTFIWYLQRYRHHSSNIMPPLKFKSYSSLTCPLKLKNVAYTPFDRVLSRLSMYL